VTLPRGLWLNVGRLVVVGVILAIWEWAFALNARYDWLIPDFLDPYFVSRPSEIWARFVRLACFADRAGWTLPRGGAFTACLAQSQNNLWIGTLVTLKNTFWGFVAGVSSGVVIGLVLGRSALLAKFFEPFIVAVNSIPRIALIPFIILLFGLGDISKIVTAWIIVFFVVFFNTFEGARAVDRDHIAVARLFGASHWQVTATVIIPSTMAWVFAALTPAVSFSLIGVIVGEFIGAERGVGKIIVEAEARAQAADMMVALFVLMVVGVLLALMIRRIQAYLLRWQAHFQRGP
jgi:sulfonate transport system permease protein